MQIFDRRLLKLNKSKTFDCFAESAFLFEIALDSIGSRLFLKELYDKALFIGMRNVKGAELILDNPAIKEKVFADSAYKFLEPFRGDKIIIDEENLPFAHHSFDLIISLLNIHTINLVPEFFRQISAILKPGGVFIGSLFGSNTLKELKTAFAETEIQMNIPTSPHIFPMPDIKAVANLAVRCGFIEPVTDSEIIKAHYTTLSKLFVDLTNMGERNVMHLRTNRFLPRNFLLELEKTYRHNCAIYDHENKTEILPASFEIIYLTAFNT